MHYMAEHKPIANTSRTTTRKGLIRPDGGVVAT